MTDVAWSDAASENLDSVVSYIEQFDPAAAARIGARLHAMGESLTVFPERGRPAGGGVRELVGVAPYVLRYRVLGEQVLILGLRHGRRRPLGHDA